jgi:hypothetical protein
MQIKRIYIYIYIPVKIIINFSCIVYGQIYFFLLLEVMNLHGKARTYDISMFDHYQFTTKLNDTTLYIATSNFLLHFVFVYTQK